MQDLIITHTADGEVCFECIFIPGKMEMFTCFIRYSHNSYEASFNRTLTIKDMKQACQKLYIGEDGNDVEDDDMIQIEIMSDVKAYDNIIDTVPAVHKTAILVIINSTVPKPSVDNTVIHTNPTPIDAEADLFALPTRLGGMGIRDPT